MARQLPRERSHPFSIHPGRALAGRKAQDQMCGAFEAFVDLGYDGVTDVDRPAIEPGVVTASLYFERQALSLGMICTAMTNEDVCHASDDRPAPDLRQGTVPRISWDAVKRGVACV